jgi:hypothetical protein
MACSLATITRCDGSAIPVENGAGISEHDGVFLGQYWPAMQVPQQAAAGRSNGDRQCNYGKKRDIATSGRNRGLVPNVAANRCQKAVAATRQGWLVKSLDWRLPTETGMPLCSRPRLRTRISSSRPVWIGPHNYPLLPFDAILEHR